MPCGNAGKHVLESGEGGSGGGTAEPPIQFNVEKQAEALLVRRQPQVPRPGVVRHRIAFGAVEPGGAQVHRGVAHLSGVYPAAHPIPGLQNTHAEAGIVQRARRRGFAVSLDDAGSRPVGVIRCDRPRALDLAARNGRGLEAVPEPIMDDVLARLAAILA